MNISSKEKNLDFFPANLSTFKFSRNNSSEAVPKFGSSLNEWFGKSFLFHSSLSLKKQKLDLWIFDSLNSVQKKKTRDLKEISFGEKFFIPVKFNVVPASMKFGSFGTIQFC